MKKLAVLAVGLVLAAISVQANIPGGGTGTGANVTVTQSGGTVTMGNGVVSIVINVSGATVTQINYTYNNGGGTQTRQLLSGGKDGGELYWEFGGFGGNPWVYSLVTNTGSYAEVDMYSDSASNGLVDVHFSMLRGSPGFYITPIWSHRAQDAAQGTGEERDNIYIAPYFNWMSVNEQVQRETGENASYTPSDYSPQENSLCTSGPLEGTYDDKYKWSMEFSSQRAWGWSSVSDASYGVTGVNVGIWHVMASWEFYNGGPMKPDLNDAPMVNMINGGHYYFGNDSGFANGEVWTRVSGPYFIYVNNVANTLTDPVQTSQALYADAKAQAAAEESAWPYSWMNNTNYASAAQRGTVTGQIVINDPYNPTASASNLWVGVEQQPADTVNNVYDFQLWMKPYEFWAKTDANGNFVISNVIAGNNYTLYAFGPGASGEFMSQNQNGGNPGITYSLPSSPFAVVVTGGATNNLGTNVWTPARVGPTVFQIGYPDRTGDKFRHGDDYWVGDIGPSPSVPSPVWDKFFEFPFDFPNGLNYVVGQNRWNTDWNYVQSVYPDNSGNNTVSSSTVTFNLASAPAGGATASVLMGIASDDNTPIYVTVNGTLLSGGNTTGTPTTSLPTTGWYPNNDISDSNIREENRGGYSDERLTFAGSLLHAGNNTINFSFRQAGGANFTHHFMYDYIRLELTGYVPPAPTGVTAYSGNNSVLLSWPAVAGATSYNILRSTTNGTGYVSITNGVTGPICGSGPANDLYVDNTAVNGTNYYYVVRSVNPVNSSANSPSSAVVIPSAAIATNAPAAPTGLTVTSTNNAVTFTWNAVTGANFYTVYRGTVVNKIGYIPFYIVLSDTVTNTTYTDASGTLGCTYGYFVTATSAAGTSTNSVVVTGKPVPPSPVSPPANVRITDNITSTNQTPSISWSPVTGAVGYILYRANSPTGPFSFPGNYLQSMTTTTYTDGALANNTLYSYMVVAMNAGGVTTNSVVVSTPALAPATLSAKSGNARITLTWAASLGATSYTIMSGTSSGNETATVGTTTNTSYTVTNLLNGTNYFFVVIAVDAGGNSPVSPEVSVIPLGPRSLIWQGDGWANIWDLSNSTNWQYNGAATFFNNGDSVTFDDTGSNNIPVALNGPLQPALVTVNAAGNYTLSGLGSLTGTNSLIKSGSGTLTLATANTYTGGTLLNAGTVGFGLAGNSNLVAALQPVLWLTFDQVGGGVVTNLGTGGAAMNGTLVGANVSIVPGGHSGNALSVGNGSFSTSYVLVNNPVTTLNGATAGSSWTVGLWLKTSTSGGAYLYQGSGGWVSGDTSFFLTSATQNGSGTTFPGGHVGGVRWGGGWMGGTINVNDNNWHFVAITDAAGVKNVYVDGNLDTTYSASQIWTTVSAGNQLWIGGSADTGDGNAAFNGLIDEIYVFSNVLSQAQILTLMGPATNSPGQLPAVSPVSVAAPATLDLSGYPQNIASLSDLSGGGGLVTNSSGNNVTLTISNNVPGTITFSGVINNAAGHALGLVKIGSYTQVLAGTNNYTGPTTVTGGSLLVNGSLGTSVVTITNSTLGGAGTLNGATTIQPGGVLAPGPGYASLTFGNALTLNGTTLLKISHAPLTNDLVTKTGSLSYAGKLIVTNTAGTLAAGDNFKLFSAPNYTGAFASMVLPPLTGNLLWDTNTLNASGSISVVTLSSPAITNILMAGTKLVLSGAGGAADWPFVLLSSTNLLAAQWTPLATNQFGLTGGFVFTNLISPNSPPTFYRLQLQ